MKEQNGMIKCPSCGRMYQIEQDAFQERNAHITCDCGYKISISFFTYCSSCEKIVGIDSGVHSYKELALETTKQLIKGFNPLKLSVNSSRSTNKDIPIADGDGRCMLCSTRYARCPHCHHGIEIEDGYDESALVFCTECGQQFRLK